MRTLARFVGLDYHQESIQVCVLDEQGKRLVNRSVENQSAAVIKTVLDTVALDDKGLDLIVKVSIESCSGAAHLADELICQTGWSTTLAHPGIVNCMKQSPDKTDAFVLADLVRLGYLPKVWLAPEEIRQLRGLVRFRATKVKEQTRVKLRLRGLLRELRLRPPEGINSWTRAWLLWLRRLDLDDVRAFLRDEYLDELDKLQKKSREVEKRLAERVRDDVVVRKLMSLDGIGPITAITMRAEIACFDRFNNGQQLARYAGVTPRNASSGQRQADAGLVKSGNPGLRLVLIQAAQRLIHFNQEWNAFAGRLKKKGKPHNVVVAAVANRWLRRLYHQMQSDQLVAVM
ncbi:MAG: IS110 family transposase [Fuerstiella sp.]